MQFISVDSMNAVLARSLECSVPSFPFICYAYPLHLIFTFTTSKPIFKTLFRGENPLEIATVSNFCCVFKAKPCYGLAHSLV